MWSSHGERAWGMEAVGLMVLTQSICLKPSSAEFSPVKEQQQQNDSSSLLTPFVEFGWTGKILSGLCVSEYI